MKLIPEWKNAWRLMSVQIAALAVGWVALPTETQSDVLRFVGLSEDMLPAVLGVLVIVARLIAQPKIRE